MKKRIAVPTEKGILCAHFGHCREFTLLDVDDHSITREEFLTPPPHEPGILPAWIARQGVTDVIAGGMGQRAIHLFNGHRINVYVGAPLKSPRDLAHDLISGKLEAGANYCDH
jgi:predicted Fe-Mo cluster-binding NifX family protein